METSEQGTIIGNYADYVQCKCGCGTTFWLHIKDGHVREFCITPRSIELDHAAKCINAPDRGRPASEFERNEQSNTSTSSNLSHS